MAGVNSNAVVLQMNDWQAVSFQLRGDEVKPNWGDCLLATNSPLLSGYTQANATDSRNAFIAGKRSPPSEALPPRTAKDNWLVSSFTFDYGVVAANGKPVSSFVVFFHNEQFSVDYFHDYQAPYWKHRFGSWQKMLHVAFKVSSPCSSQRSVNLKSRGPHVFLFAINFDRLPATTHKQVEPRDFRIVNYYEH